MQSGPEQPPARSKGRPVKKYGNSRLCGIDKSTVNYYNLHIK